MLKSEIHMRSTCDPSSPKLLTTLSKTLSLQMTDPLSLGSKCRVVSPVKHQQLKANSRGAQVQLATIPRYLSWSIKSVALGCLSSETSNYHPTSYWLFLPRFCLPCLSFPVWLCPRVLYWILPGLIQKRDNFNSCPWRLVRFSPFYSSCYRTDSSLFPWAFFRVGSWLTAEYPSDRNC